MVRTMHEARRHGVTALLAVAGVCWAGIAASGPEPAAAQSPVPSPVDAAVRQVSGKVGPKLGLGYGCVAHPGGNSIVLLVTGKNMVRPASRLIAGLHLKLAVKVRVIDPGNSQARLDTLYDGIVNNVGLSNPDVFVTRTVDNSGERTCGTVEITMSTGAPAWVTGIVNGARQRNGPDLLTVTVVPPEQMPNIPRVPAD
jgi:hypothetical protein